MTRREMLFQSLAGTTLSLGNADLFAAQNPEGNLRPHWSVKADHLFHGALTDGIGFSFSYDGKKFGPAILSGWKVSTQTTPGVDQTIFRHPSGLTIIREERLYSEFEALEYTLRFKNEGRSSLPILGPVNALVLSFGGEVLPGVSAVWSGGGGREPTFPPADFAITRTYFGPMMPLKGDVELTGGEGMPSRVNLPFFFIENQNNSAGIYVSIGWTGNWKASIRANFDNDILYLRGGMPGINLKLHPGEEISSPSILVGAYRGPLSTGVNALRKLVRDRYAPTVSGQRLQAPIYYDTWIDIGTDLDEKLFKTLVDSAAEIGQEIFLLDAGWYNGSPRCPYTDMALWDAISNSLGNWEEGEDRTRFPSGLRVLADYVRSKGMQFGLWFEPERVGPGSLLAKTHPDWIIWQPERKWWKWGMVYFGKPEVQEYFCKVLDRFIEELGLRYIRWDHNNNLMWYCDSQDAPDRRGISQVRHLEGVHRVEEWVQQHHPDVILESCAGGGQRIDLLTLKHRHTIWISDRTEDPHIVRFHLEGLNHFVPGNAQAVAFAPPPASYRKPGFTFPDIAFQSHFGGAFGSGGRLHEWPASMKSQARKHFDTYKKIRRFLSEDYYLLAPQPRDLDTWEAWQFHDPKADEGFVQVFRIRAPTSSKNIVLQALDRDATYRFSDAYTGETLEVAGAKATSDGISFELPQMSSRILIYKKVR